MRYVLLFSSLLAVALLGTAGCQTSQNTLMDDAPQAAATRSPVFEPQEHEKIAVLVRDNVGLYYGDEGVRHQVENAFSQAANRKGYRLATRSQVEDIKEEIRFEDGTIWTERGGAEPGHLHNVSALLIVSIDESFVRDEPSLPSKIPDPNRSSFLGELLDNFLDAAPRERYYAEASVSASLISVREAEVLWQGRYTGVMQIEEGQPGARAIPAASRVVADALPPR